MAEYIEREATYAEACKGCTLHGEEIGSCFAEEPCERLIRAFATAPAADMVKVVRCKDCKRMAEKYGMYVCNHALPTKSLNQYIEMGTDILAIVQPDDFCSYGERRNNAAD